MFRLLTRPLHQLALLAWLSLSGPSLAQAVNEELYVPDELQPWVPWVLSEREYLQCPFLFDREAKERDNYICSWPGRLNLIAERDGGEFTQTYTVYGTDAWLPLPGNAEHWPERVTIDDRPAQLVLRDNTPMLRAAPGEHTISGHFRWQQRPAVLRVPAPTGLVSLNVDGTDVARPRRDRRGLWLGEPEQSQQTQDSIEVQVYRRVSDDMPTRLTTRFVLDASGSVREVLLSPALPDGFTPLELRSELPSRLESDGRLRLQLRPGRWQVVLSARADSVVGSIGVPQPEENLPDTEIWSYDGDERLRVAVPGGLPPVDPTQAGVPEDWTGLPAFRAQAGETLTITERSRGKLAVENRLRLKRALWLDFDRGGYVFRDTVRGTMQSDWRLDVAAPFSLGSATEHGQNLLVTNGREETLSGVELRHTNIAVNGLGRIDARGRLPVTGWQARFDEIDATLNLPPGHKLFSAPGADDAPGGWIERWKLLDFFLVLIVGVAVARLFGRPAGAIALVAMLLSVHEPGAPQWLWLNLLAAIALVRVAPLGRLLRALQTYRLIAVALLLVALVPFVANQLRIALYPQLENQHLRRSVFVDEFATGAASAPAPESMETTVTSADSVRSEDSRSAGRLAEAGVAAAKNRAIKRYARYAPNAVVQAGPGVPAWQWNSYRLHWSGPVDPDSTVRLMIMPAWFVSLLRFALVAFVLAFGALAAAELAPGDWVRRLKPLIRAPDAGPAVGLIALCALGLAGLARSGPVLAEVPPADVLRQLEQRLLEPPDCVPRCAEIVEARVRAEASTLTIRLTVHALDEVAVPLPGAVDGWRPEEISIDGTATSFVYRAKNRSLWLSVPGGPSQIVLRGPIPLAHSIDIPIPGPPRRVEVTAPGWLVTGVRDYRLTAGALRLTRSEPTDAAADAAARWESARFPTFVRIERELALNLDWRVTTTVHRIAPAEGAIEMRVALLDGESVSSENVDVKDATVRVSMNPAQREFSWTSTLARRSRLTLTAAPDVPWKEVWRIAVGGIWHVAAAGVAESESGEPSAGVRMATFFPRPGESLTLDAARPEAAAGSTLAFDTVELTTRVGARSRNVDLGLNYRSTRGSQHVIRLPGAADVSSVKIDGRNEPLRAENGELTLPVLPGEHRIDIGWRNTRDVGWRERTPVVDLGAPASNIKNTLELGDDRWILATSGPRLGPAVLYWSELVVLVLFAWILSRTGLTPLKTWHWVAFGLGFSTFSWPALALVTIWLLLAGVRRNVDPEMTPWQFNLVQVLMAGLSVAALGALLATLPAGLLGTPDMHVAGNGSYARHLSWFADQSESVLPAAAVVSAPLWAYKALILVWALWLSFALLRWLPWVWNSLTRHGLWRSSPTRVSPQRAGQLENEIEHDQRDDQE